MRNLQGFFLACLGLSTSCVIWSETDQKRGPLDRLQKGNVRFLEKASPIVLKKEEAFSPFAVIVTSSDPSVTPELIFDQQPGDLFVVRTAGGIICKSQMDTVRYGAMHYTPSLIVILANGDCGAVRAVMEGNTKNIPAIAKKILPAIERLRKEGKDLTLKAVIEENALQVQREIEADPTIRKKIEQIELSVRSAYYEPQTGKVHFLPAPSYKKGEDSSARKGQRKGAVSATLPED